MKFKINHSENDRLKVEFTQPSLTDQSEKMSCDINYIIEQYVRTGDLPTSPMQYLDCTTVDDYQEAMYKVAEANSTFEQLPSKVRDEFKTVANYLEYICDPDNVQDCVNRNLINVDSVPVEILDEIQKANLAGKKFVPSVHESSPAISETITGPSSASQPEVVADTE